MTTRKELRKIILDYLNDCDNADRTEAKILTPEIIERLKNAQDALAHYREAS